MPKRQCVECPICIEPVSASKKVSCPFCSYTTCRGCMEQYVLSAMDDAACMNPECKRRFDREVMCSMFTNSFITGRYKAHRENVLLDRERSMLALTMPYVELERERRVAGVEMESLIRDREKLRQENIRIARRMTQLQRTMGRTEPDEVTSGTSSERRSFLQRCPQAECLGWLNSAWRCTICEKFACNKCLAPLGNCRAANGEHVCDPEDVASVAMIKNDSTPCPQCGVRVTKVSGCMSMWCTQCQCSFDYRSGRRINGVVHNPHYFEYMRGQNVTHRQPGDIPCGGLPGINDLVSRKGSQILFSVMRMVRHIELVEMPRYAGAEAGNRRLRVSYMLNDMAEDEFKRRIQRQEKMESKKREVALVFEMLVHTLSDELRQFVLKIKSCAQAENDIYAIIRYANNAWNQISRRYSQVSPRLSVQSISLRLAGQEIGVTKDYVHVPDCPRLGAPSQA